MATQCVEAGVDLDFPTVFRAWGPLDSIAQAGGRCNRNGKREYGELHIFELDDSAGRLYPDGSYQRASTVAKMLFRALEDPDLGIDDPDVFHRYFEMLYSVSELETLNPELLEAMQRLDFVEVARRYQVIEKRAVDVLVPFDQAAFDDLARRVSFLFDLFTQKLFKDVGIGGSSTYEEVTAVSYTHLTLPTKRIV